jgi:hypothetical protein
MALHKIFRGDASEAAKLLPFALNKLRSLKELLSSDSGSRIISVGPDRTIRLSVTGNQEKVEIWAEGGTPYWCRSKTDVTPAQLQAAQLKPSLTQAQVKFKAFGTFPLETPVDEDTLIGKAFAITPGALVAARVDSPNKRAAFYHKPRRSLLSGAPTPVNPFLSFTYTGTGGYVPFLYEKVIGLGVLRTPVSALGVPTTVMDLMFYNYTGQATMTTTMDVDVTPLPGYNRSRLNINAGQNDHFYVALTSYQEIGSTTNARIDLTRRPINTPNAVLATYTLTPDPVVKPLNDFIYHFISHISEHAGTLFVIWCKRTFLSAGTLDSTFSFDLFTFDVATGALLTLLRDVTFRTLVIYKGILYAFTMPSVTFAPARASADLPFALDTYSYQREETNVAIQFRRRVAEGNVHIVPAPGETQVPVLEVDNVNYFSRVA